MWVEVNQMSTSQTTGDKVFQFSYSWPYQDTDEEVSVCKSGCILGVFFEGGKIYNIDSASLGATIITPTDNCYTMQCLWGKWTAKYGTGISVSTWETSQSDSELGCWSFLAFPYGSGNSVTGQGVRLPGATCVSPPPENVKCEIENLSDFNHGELSSSNVNTSKINQTAILNCNAKASVSAYLGYEDGVRLTGGASNIKSIIAINNNPLTSTTPVVIEASAGNNNLDISSELKADTHVDAGEYVGSNVIILDVN